MFRYPLLITTGSNLETSKTLLLKNQCDGSQNRWAVLFCGLRKVLGKCRCSARCRRAREMRRAARRQIAKEPLLLVMKSGKCRQNARLSMLQVVRIYAHIVGIITSRQSRTSFRKFNEKRADTIAAFIGVAEQERRVKQLCERVQNEGGIEAPCNMNSKCGCGHIHWDSKHTCA